MNHAQKYALVMQFLNLLLFSIFTKLIHVILYTKNNQDNWIFSQQLTEIAVKTNGGVLLLANVSVTHGDVIMTMIVEMDLMN